jgi:hypothetical protein
MKEWILRYAEQQDEEEKGEGSKGLEEEEKFDPVSRALSLASSTLLLPGERLSHASSLFFSLVNWRNDS